MEIRIAVTIGVEEVWVPCDSFLELGNILIVIEGIDSGIDIALFDLVR